MSNVLNEIRSVQNFGRAIIRSVEIDTHNARVNINVVTDSVFTDLQVDEVKKICNKYVPLPYLLKINAVKLTPDCDMVKNKILSHLERTSKVLYSVIVPQDVVVRSVENGFEYDIAVIDGVPHNKVMIENVSHYLKTVYCGDFFGKFVEKRGDLASVEIEEEHENIEYEVPLRTFEIVNFSPIDSESSPKRATYMCDVNYVGDVVICGTVEDILQRTYKNKKGEEKEYFVFVLSDTTATMYATCFIRKKNEDKIRAVKVGDSIVCTGKTEQFKGRLNFTIKNIDYGTVPKNFVPEKRTSKPVPKYYTTIKPQPFSDFVQSELFSDVSVPDCLKNNTFVVIDLETTGLNSVATDGNMDKIIEIGAFKIKDGNICESFSTFINPECKLSKEITDLTGISQDMVKDAPVYEKVMPDLFKFCEGSYLVGHNIAGFDFKFINYYCSKQGYFLERKLFDTIYLAQELLFLSNYKLNTLADHFGFTFNHHRAIDDALVTAKVFIELIKIKKSLPKLA